MNEQTCQELGPALLPPTCSVTYLSLGSLLVWDLASWVGAVPYNPLTPGLSRLLVQVSSQPADRLPVSAPVKSGPSLPGKFQVVIQKS